VKYKDLVFTVSYSEEDQEWVATCDRFPSLSWLDIEPDWALSGLARIIRKQVTEAR
jgi:hypothetical protein